VLNAVRNENIAVHSLAVKHLPRSGKPEELLALEGIDAGAIVKMVRDLY